MKEENKKEIKKGILTGLGTVAGAGIGAVIENTMNAADVEVKEIPEVEVVEAVVEDLDETPEVAQSTLDVEALSTEIKDKEPALHISHPHKKPAQQNVGDSISNPALVEESEPFIEAEAVIEVEPDPELVVLEESVADEDIMVVSVAHEESDEEEADVYDAASSTSYGEVISEDDSQAPDYADMKDSDLNVGGSIMSTVDMPDYVNDANIDSFTENV